MSLHRTDELIERYQLQSHPEGGYFAETYRSEVLVDTPRGKRSASTAITFLLKAGDVSHFHRIESDELWHFYEGGDLEIHELIDGDHRVTILNRNNPQHTVQAGLWFASKPADQSDYSFVGCTVAPGFDFADFEMANKEQLQKEFPKLVSILEKLCLN